MRVSIAVAVACLGLVGISQAGDASASIRRPTNIPAQTLRPALQQLSKERDLQLVFRTDLVGELKTNGVSGELTFDEALGQLLDGTGLTYKYLNEKTVTILPVATATAPAMKVKDDTAAVGKEAQKSRGFWDRFRVAEADVGAAGVKDDEESTKLEEVVVTAQKREERLKDVPISISVLGGGELDSSSFVSVTEALNTVPGLVASVSRQGGGTAITIRGVGNWPIATGASQVAYYLDSVPFGFASNGFAPDTDAYDLARVEVLRGPQGTLYGANAENGVVRVLTHDADLTAFEAKARATTSTTDGGGGNYRGNMAINVPIVEGKLAARAVVGYEDYSGWVNSPSKKHVNDSTLRTFRLKVNAHPSDALTIGLSAWRSLNDFGAPSSSNDDHRITTPVSQPIETDYDAYGLAIKYQFSRFSISSNTSYLDFSNGGSQNFGPLFASLAEFSIFTGFDSKVTSQEFLLASTNTSPWRWTAGAFYRDSKEEGLQRIPNYPGLPDPFTHGVGRSKSSAVFGELGRRFMNDKLEWTLGLRYFHDSQDDHDEVPPPPGTPPFVSSASFHATTPRAVLTWYPSKDLTIYGSYSEGFRSGAGQGQVVLQAAPGFPDLGPEKLRNYEIGAKGDLFDRRISFETALFYINLRDTQQTITIPYGSIEITPALNAGSASGVGMDFGITARPLTGLSLGVNFSWNDLTFDDDLFSNVTAGTILFEKGERLNVSSKYTGGAFATYGFPLGVAGLAGSFSASVNHSSKQYYRSGVFDAAGVPLTLNGDSVTIARTNFSVSSSDRWSATAFVDNVTNAYPGQPSHDPVEEWYNRIRPRTIGLQLDYRY